MLFLCHDQWLKQMELDELAITQDEARGMKGTRSMTTAFVGGESGESKHGKVTRSSSKVRLIDSAKSRVACQ